MCFFFFFSSRRRHTRLTCDWSSDVCSSDLHPATHGTVRIVLTVEGETIQDADVQVGYLHRAFEKESEYATYTQVFPYTDRLNYVSPMLNNVGYALAVEKLLGLHGKLPKRAEYIRVIVSE